MYQWKSISRLWGRVLNFIDLIIIDMGAGLAGRPPCPPHSQVLMGDGLAGGPPCPPHSQVLMGDG